MANGNGDLKQGSYKKVAHQHGVTVRQVGRAYREMIKNVETYINAGGNLLDGPLPDYVFDNKRKNCKGTTRYDREALGVAIKETSIKERETYRHMSSRMGIPKSTLHMMCRKEKFLIKWRASLKPTLTEQNKLDRLHYALEMIQPQPNATRNGLHFNNMFNYVHIDEKWFYVIRDGAKYLLVFDEKPPKLTTRHKKKISKVQFICAVARPRHVYRNNYFDGKIGIWPFGNIKRAIRDSANRPRGTEEWENVTIDTPKYAELLANEIIPAIIAKWPAVDWNDDSNKIIIQHDGAPAHQRFEKHYWDNILDQIPGAADKFELLRQPANSPDTNVLDLGFFRSLQAKYYLNNPKNEMDIIRFVKQTFEEYDPRILNCIWITHQTCLDQIIHHDGDNDYITPHLNKDRLERQNRLPESIKVTADVTQWM